MINTAKKVWGLRICFGCNCVGYITVSGSDCCGSCNPHFKTVGQPKIFCFPDSGQDKCPTKLSCYWKAFRHCTIWCYKQFFIHFENLKVYIIITLVTGRVLYWTQWILPSSKSHKFTDLKSKHKHSQPTKMSQSDSSQPFSKWHRTDRSDGKDSACAYKISQ